MSEDGNDLSRDLESQPFCYVTTTGRVSGRPHTIEIWFAHRDGTIYMLADDGRRADWVRNLEAAPGVTVRVGDNEVPGAGRVVTDGGEARMARDSVFAKYQPGYSGDLADWRESALPVAVDLVARSGRQT